MPLVPVGKISLLPANSVMEVVVGERPYAICNVAGSIHAVDGVCPHQGGPLGQGQIHDGRLVCPYHMWEFDCRTGAYGYAAGRGIATFEVQVAGDEIFLQVP